MSDVGLAKRCRAVDVPIPYRGYWARKAAGQEPPKLPLPKYRSRTPVTTAAAPLRPEQVEPTVRSGPEPEVGFGLPSPDSAPGLQRPTTTPTDHQTWLDHVAALGIKPTTTVAETCAAVRRTALHEKLPDRKGLKFERGEKLGGIIDLSVTQGALPRALLLADLFVRTAAGLGWPL